MPIGLKEDVMYILLKKIHEEDEKGKHHVDFQATDFTGRNLGPADFIGHLDYLNQKGFIDADFTGNAYANQEDVPSAVESDTIDFRVANTFGAADGPLPHLIRFERAQLTDKGRKLLQKMEENPPKALQTGASTPIATKNMPFLEKVMLKGELEDIFDARDVTEVVYRTMRDMMTNEAVDRVESELHKQAEPTDDKTLQNEIADLWKDTNPLVSWISKIRQPLKIKDETFLFRVKQEGGLPKSSNPEEVITAVFSATKEELSQDRIQEIGNFLPGKIKQLWEKA